MGQKFKRNLFLHVNDFQKHIIYPVIIATFFACFVTLFFLYYFYLVGEGTHEIFKVDIYDFKIALPWFMTAVLFMLIFVIFWTYYISNKLVGPYSRILRELDETIEGKRRAPLGARKGDDIFEQLLKRINILIERMK